MRRRAVGVLVLGALVAPLGGCERSGPRISQRALQSQLSRAYKVVFDARAQLARGRRGPRTIVFAGFTCRPLGPEPSNDRGWTWNCVLVVVAPKGAHAQRSQYSVDVDARGCFEAKTGSVPRRVPEPVVGNRLVPNPLRRFFGCGA
jgi:hypothetical protein